MIYWCSGLEARTMIALARMVRQAQYTHDEGVPECAGHSPEVHFSTSTTETENQNGNPTIVRRYEALLVWTDDDLENEVKSDAIQS